MRLETTDGKFVADVEPVFPAPMPDLVVFWGERVFVKHTDDTWRETLPLVCRTAP